MVGSDSRVSFVEQEYCYSQAIAELRSGQKRSHWIWYIFLQLKGLGYSYNSNYYGINGKEEAIEYLNHPVLGKRLRDASDAVSPGDVFANVLERYYAGERDTLMQKLLDTKAFNDPDSM